MESKILDFLEDGFLDELKSRLGQEALTLIDEEFNTKEDPYGAEWAPTKNRPNPILVDTGNLKENFALQIDPDGFTIRNDVDYGIYHQTGTSKMPQRMILPNNNLPDKWADKFEAIFDQLVREIDGK